MNTTTATVLVACVIGAIIAPSATILFAFIAFLAFMSD